MGFKSVAGSVFKTAFPFISTAVGLGGPLGAMAANFVGQHLGVDLKAEGVDAAIASAISKDPEAMLKLRDVEDNFALAMAKLGFDTIEKLESIDAADRNNARAREIAIKDKIPGFLAIFTTLGFFGMLIFVIMHGVAPEVKDLVNIMLGSLGTAWISIITYYFGSSRSSAEKTQLMAKAQLYAIDGGKAA